MIEREKHQIKYEGTLDFETLSISCYVLRDGTRVLSGRGMQNALKIGPTDKKEEEKSGSKINVFLSSKWFKSLIINDLNLDRFSPILCYNGNQKINGFEATVLVDICDLILQARKDGVKFSDKQLMVAEQCEILVRNFAKVGIIALVDEATGYQYDRERDELQKILKAYISENLLPWQKTFPDIFYIELFRLNKWDFTVRGIKKRPSVIGTWTKKLVYEQLPPDVLGELERNVPKSDSGHKTARFHQLLTEDIGNPHLRDQINQIITIFKLSDDMDQVWANFEKIKN